MPVWVTLASRRPVPAKPRISSARGAVRAVGQRIEDLAVDLDLQDPAMAYQARRQRGLGRSRRLRVLERGIGGDRIGRLHSRTEGGSGNGPTGRLEEIGEWMALCSCSVLL